MQVRLLGPVEVVDGDGTIAFPRTKERAVLAALALRAGEVVSEPRLHEALWGDDPPPTADKALQTHISRVRKALGPTGAAIERHPGGYRLAPDGLEVDAARAEQLLAEARAATDAEAALGFLEEAAALWRGPSLGDLAVEAFAQGEAARLDELRVVIAEERIGSELALGRHDRVIAELEALCAQHPLRERLWSLRMLALYRAGRQPEALRTYQELRAHFVDEFGLEPSEETRALDAAIARGDPQLALESAPAPESSKPSAALPTGVVTFLLTDIEGSTALWEAHPQTMGQALARHDEVIAAAVAAQGGTLLKTRGEGDSTFSVFASVSQAAAAAIALERQLLGESLPEGIELRVRASIHTGEAELRDGDYFGASVNRAARLRAIAHGGQVVCSQSSAELLQDHLPDGAGLRSLGSHRLQDLARPEVVFQLCHPSLPEDFPPLQSLESVPNNLPVQLTSFVGRVQEMADIAELLGGHRLVTLTGSAGCGKTRLAVQLGAERLHDYPDGVWLVDLAPLGDPELLVQTVATALGVREPPATVVSAVANAQPTRSLVDLVVEHLHARALLLVLDNCEHLLEPAAVFAEALLRACPELRILSTSREALGVRGEVTWRVRSLSVPAGPQDVPLEVLREYESIRLFVDRAKACDPSFELTERDGRAVAQICRRLDGIPLAIELAASRVEVLAPTELAARLDDRFRVLTGGSRTGLERHQTLRAAVDWSYDALPAAERALLERLSVFAGGCTLETAEAVCAGGEVGREDVLDLLSRLVAKSLVVMDRGAVPARYRLLETIRQYAREKLSTEAATELRSRHLDWCLDFTGQAARGVWGPEQMRWFDRLEDEEDNLRQALEWTIGGGDAENALHLVGELGRFWMVRRRVDEGLRWTLAALALDGAAYPYMRAQALVSAALSLVGYFGAYDEARQLALESLELFRQLGIRRGTFWALHTASITALFQGDVDSAVGYGDEALSVAREAGHTGTLVYGLLNRADVGIAEGDFDLVDRLLGEALPLLRRADDKIGLVRLLGIQGYVAIRAGRYADAVPFLEETVARSEEIGDDSAVIWALANLGCVTLVTGDLPAARRWFDRATSTGREGGTGGSAVGGGGKPRKGGVSLGSHEARIPIGERRTDTGMLERLGLEGPARTVWPAPAADPDASLYAVPGSAVGGGGMTVSSAVSLHASGGIAGGVESTFLDVFVLNGLAELALADNDVARASAIFADALRRLQVPVQMGDLGTGSASMFAATFGTPVGDSRHVGEKDSYAGAREVWRRGRERTAQSTGLPLGVAGADLELLRARRAQVSAPRAMPVAGLSHMLGWNAKPEPEAGMGGLATPTTDRTPAGVSGAVFTPTSGSIGDRVLVPSVLAGIAKAAAVLGAHDRAARLFGAAEHSRGFTTTLHRQGRWILFEHRYDEMVAKAREALGEAAFDAAFADGQAMTTEAAVEYAMDTLSRGVSEAP